jgi:carbamoyl-phosphate synthase large subunit
MKILVTGAGAVLGQGIIKSLRQSTLDCTIVAADPNALSCGLYWADSAYQLPMADYPAFGDAIDTMLAREQPDAVLVGTDVELGYFAQHRVRLESTFRTRILVSDPEVIAIADDKFETYRFLLAAGLDPPASAKSEDVAAISDLIDTVGFPLIVKPRTGARSVGVSIVRNMVELTAALENRQRLIVQECIGTDEREYTASALVFDGAVKASIVMRRDLRDGNTYRAFADCYDALNAMVQKYAFALQPYGPANFQFRVDRNGKPRVFEINARFSGTTPMRALVGFNEVEMCMRWLLLGTPIVQPKIRRATVLRYLQEMVVEQEQVETVT